MVWFGVRKLLLDLVHSHERLRENGERERECRCWLLAGSLATRLKIAMATPR